MRSSSGEPLIPAERLAEAGVWIARLHGLERDAAVESGLRQWLGAHALNPRAFELATEVWEESQNLRRVVSFSPGVTPRRERRLRSPLLAIATSLIATAAVGVVVTLLYLHRQQDIATGVGEQRLLVLQDGTRVYLNTLTRLVTHYDETARRIELTAGEAWFDVAKKSGWPFIVTAGGHQVTALGTSFVVRYDVNHMDVTLLEGKVDVRSDDGSQLRAVAAPVQETPVVTLTPGQRLRFSAGAPAHVDTPPIDRVMAWRRGDVIFDDMLLGHAVEEMNRYSASKLEVESAAAARILINGVFQAGDSASFANAVAQTYALRVVERGDQIVLAGVPTSVAPPPGRSAH